MPFVRRSFGVIVVLALEACAPRGEASAPSPRNVDSTGSAATNTVSQKPRTTDPRSPAASGDGKKMTASEARRYMVELINRDRASEGLAPVVMDEGPATRAGQAHADDMAAHGFLGHWGTDGSVPEQRLTEAGGSDMVMENASCFTDEKVRVLDRAARIDPKSIELAEDMFFHEQPPNDGHRRNILKPWHKKVGIGVAQPVATPTELPAPCIAQEFVDPYGSYGSTPRRMHVGQTLHVEGTIHSPATFAGVGLARVDTPKPLSPDELNRRRTYPVPMPYQMFWPPGYQTPIPVKVTGSRFSVDLPLSDRGKEGLYELSVWASVPGTPDLIMVSLRTIQGGGPP